MAALTGAVIVVLALLAYSSTTTSCSNAGPVAYRSFGLGEMTARHSGENNNNNTTSEDAVAAVLGSGRGSCRLQDGLLRSKRAKHRKITSELRTVLHADTPRSHPLSRHNERSLLGLLPPTGAGLQRWLEWDPGLDPGSVPAFGSSAVRARLGVLCRSSRWLRWDPGDRDGDSGRPPPFGPSAVRARLGVPCRLGRRLR